MCPGLWREKSGYVILEGPDETYSLGCDLGRTAAGTATCYAQGSVGIVGFQS